jgi:hypothetical protein
MTEETLLHRQVNPAWVQNGRPSSQTFRPTPKDQFKLSLYDGDQINPEASWHHFTSLINESGRTNESVGVLSLTVLEFATEGLQCVPSPEIFKEHAHADYADLTDGQIRKKGQRLLVVAVARGWQYQA